jgi:hypothetical protein
MDIKVLAAHLVIDLGTPFRFLGFVRLCSPRLFRTALGFGSASQQECVARSLLIDLAQPLGLVITFVGF